MRVWPGGVFHSERQATRQARQSMQRAGSITKA